VKLDASRPHEPRLAFLPRPRSFTRNAALLIPLRFAAPAGAAQFTRRRLPSNVLPFFSAPHVISLQNRSVRFKSSIVSQVVVCSSSSVAAADDSAAREGYSKNKSIDSPEARPFSNKSRSAGAAFPVLTSNS
jgi:hypothetical protein